MRAWPTARGEGRSGGVSSPPAHQPTSPPAHQPVRPRATSHEPPVPFQTPLRAAAARCPPAPSARAAVWLALPARPGSCGCRRASAVEPPSRHALGAAQGEAWVLRCRCPRAPSSHEVYINSASTAAMKPLATGRTAWGLLSPANCPPGPPTASHRGHPNARSPVMRLRQLCPPEAHRPAKACLPTSETVHR